MQSLLKILVLMTMTTIAVIAIISLSMANLQLQPKRQRQALPAMSKMTAPKAENYAFADNLSIDWIVTGSKQ